MKKKIILTLVFLVVLSTPLCAGDDTALSNMFFIRQPSARAESMGKGGVALDENVFAKFYNPACIGTNNGISLGYSHSSPEYLALDAYYNYFYLYSNIGNFGVIGLSYDLFNFNESVPTTNMSGEITGEITPKTYLYSVSYNAKLFEHFFSNEVFKDFYTGINVNIFDSNWMNDNSLSTDLGILKKLRLSEKNNILQNLKFGLSLFNLTNSEISGDELPVILRLGSAYELSWEKSSVFSNLKLINLLCHFEYQDLLNLKYRSAVKFGGELTLFEVLAFRCGYFKENLNDYGFKENKDYLKDFTYGIGAHAPLYKITENKIPLNINFDFVKLEQPSSNKTKFEDFLVYSLSLTYQL